MLIRISALLVFSFLVFQDPDAKATLRAKYGARFAALSEEDSRTLLKFEEAAFKFLRSRAAADLKGFETLPLETAKAILRFGGTGCDAELMPGETIKRSIRVDEKDVDLKVRVPKCYARLAEDGSVARLPVLLGLVVEKSLLDQPLFQVTLPSELWYSDGWGAGLVGIHTIAAAIREVVDTLPIDPDRVFLHGFSAIGYGSWHAALYHCDLIAGIYTSGSMPVAVLLNKGTTRERICLPPLTNLLEMSNHWIVDPKDTGHFPEYMLKPVLARMDALKFRDFQRCIDPAPPCPSCADLYGWLKTRSLVLYPTEVVLESDEKNLKRNRWVEILRFKNRETYRLPIKLGNAEDLVEERFKFVEMVRVKATVNRTANSVAVEAEGADQVRIYLASELLDLTREVKITVNGKIRWQKIPERGVLKLLEAAAQTGNRNLPYETWADVAP